jgi:hypothetical protein
LLRGNLLRTSPDDLLRSGAEACLLRSGPNLLRSGSGLQAGLPAAVPAPMPAEACLLRSGSDLLRPGSGSDLLRSGRSELLRELRSSSPRRSAGPHPWYLPPASS